MRLDAVIATSYYLVMNDNYYMELAYKEALKALKYDEVPVGAIIVHNDKVIARAYNKKETSKRAIAHAEVLAIEKANKKIGDFRLEDCVMYVTLEPCIMCAGAIVSSRIKRVVYGASDPRFGACKSMINIFDLKLNHNVILTGGVLEEKCSKLIVDFFKELRKN